MFDENFEKNVILGVGWYMGTYVQLSKDEKAR